jgi:hypothetical protein
VRATLAQSRVEAGAAIALALVAGTAAAAQPVMVAGALVAGALVVVVMRRPAMAAYLVIGLTPVLAGIDRGALVPVLRPNEALDLLLALALALRFATRARHGQLRLRRPDAVERAMLAMALASSVLPLVWMGLRQVPITGDDVQYALVLWKYLGVYVIVRVSVRTEPEVRRCLHVSLAAACVVGSVAIAQALGLSSVRSFLAVHYTVNGNAAAVDLPRGSSTLALPAAMGDLMCLNLAIAVGLLRTSTRHRVALGAVSVLLVLAALSAGEFSSAIGLVIAALVVVLVMRDYNLLAWFPALGALGVVAVWPVIETRLAEFQTLAGLPPSWLGRLYNLQNYFWPQLLDDHSYLLGVRSSARIALPHKANGFIWIESGYTWLLWSGGIPLLAAFAWFAWTAARRGVVVARGSSDAVQVAGLALVTIVVVISVLMVFDPHVTYRGTADALFGLVALTALRTPPPTGDGPPRPRRWLAAAGGALQRYRLMRSSGTAPAPSTGSAAGATTSAAGEPGRAPGEHQAPPRVPRRSTPPASPPPPSGT